MVIDLGRNCIWIMFFFGSGGIPETISRIASLVRERIGLENNGYYAPLSPLRGVIPPPPLRKLHFTTFYIPCIKIPLFILSGEEANTSQGEKEPPPPPPGENVSYAPG